jgi:hypothetical protein
MPPTTAFKSSPASKSSPEIHSIFVESIVMSNLSYAPPLDQLLTYGEVLATEPENWPDYLALGITQEHIPELLRMATDNTLYNTAAEDPASWAPVHVWRTLGQLQAREALEPLVEMVRQKAADLDWDFLIEEGFPDVFALIGPASLPVLQTYLAETAGAQTEGFASLLVVVDALEKIVERHPETRDQGVAIVTQQLEAFEQNTPEWNGWLISLLTDWQALESIALIEQAFQAKRVAEFVVGDWDEVQVAFGLKSREEVPRQQLINVPTPNFRSDSREAASPQDSCGDGGGRKSDKTKTRAKRKLQADSRKKNRPKKKKKK